MDRCRAKWPLRSSSAPPKPIKWDSYSWTNFSQELRKSIGRPQCDFSIIIREELKNIGKNTHTEEYVWGREGKRGREEEGKGGRERESNLMICDRRGNYAQALDLNPSTRLINMKSRGQTDHQTCDQASTCRMSLWTLLSHVYKRESGPQNSSANIGQLNKKQDSILYRMLENEYTSLPWSPILSPDQWDHALGRSQRPPSLGIHSHMEPLGKLGHQSPLC